MTLTISILCAVGAAVCAFLAFRWSRKCELASTEVTGIASSLRNARSAIEAHDSELESLADALRTLRGKFYAERRISQKESAEAENRPAQGSTSKEIDPAVDPVAWKREMRAKLGLTPSIRN